jgi:hypothetical protein
MLQLASVAAAGTRHGDRRDDGQTARHGHGGQKHTKTCRHAAALFLDYDRSHRDGTPDPTDQPADAAELSPRRRSHSRVAMVTTKTIAATSSPTITAGLREGL